MAATNGIRGNNTYALEKQLGWKGICIEPNPCFHKELCENRNCTILKQCIDGTNDNTVDFRVDIGGNGGIIAKDTDNKTRTGRCVKMKTKTLESILDENNAPKIIDYLSFDVEGAETRILKTFPFEKYTFLSMTIERVKPALAKLLEKKGYVFIRKYRGRRTHDSYYVHKSIANLDQIKRSNNQNLFI